MRCTHSGLRIFLRTSLCLTAALSLSGLAVAPAGAVDTVETFEQGASDYEFYLGAGGLGGGEYASSLSGSFQLGIGIIPGFSGYLNAEVAGNERFGAGAAAFGIFGTPLDTDHVDLDLLLDVSIGGAGLGDFGVTPGLELNFDLSPDLGWWGLYLGIGLGLSARDVSTDVKESYELVPDLNLAVGSYYTVAEGHQILLQVDGVAHFNPDKGERDFDLGGVALGYNVAIHDSIELITEVSFDIPQGDENFAVGLLFGFVATIPSPAQTARQ